MSICPVDLERCDRPECAGGHCELAGELRLAPCADCGYLIVMRGAVICVDCIGVELVEATEV